MHIRTIRVGLAALLAALAAPSLAVDREGDALENRPASRAVPGPQEEGRDDNEQGFIEAEEDRKAEERISEEGPAAAREKQRLERRSGPTGTRRDRKLEERRLREERRRKRAVEKERALPRGVEEGRDEERGARGKDAY